MEGECDESIDTIESSVSMVQFMLENVYLHVLPNCQAKIDPALVTNSKFD